MKPQLFFIDSTDGKLKWIPEMPKKEDYSMRSSNIPYMESVKLAKKEAVEVSPECRQAIEMKLCRSYTYPLRDEIMTINMEEKIEVVNGPIIGYAEADGYPLYKKVAKIIPKKAEEPEFKSGIHHNFNIPIGDSVWAASNDAPKAEESEDDSIRAIFNLFGGAWHHCSMDEEDAIIKAVKEKFEIKRKA